jgi:hypothetical protein
VAICATGWLPLPLSLHEGLQTVPKPDVPVGLQSQVGRADDSTGILGRIERLRMLQNRLIG